MELFHHFQTHTQRTLLFTPDVWDHVLQLSLQFDFLMNALLGISARHLTFLRPEVAIYPTAAASHLCRALSLFRDNLSGNFSSTHLDAFVATSLLLQYAVWTSIDFVSRGDDGVEVVDPEKDSIFSFSSGLKEVFLKCMPSSLHQPSVFMPLIRRNPWPILAKAASISDGTLTMFQEFFSQSPFNLDMLNIPLPYIREDNPNFEALWEEGVPEAHIDADPRENAYASVVTRLCLIMSFLPESQPPEPISAKSPLLPEMARVIYSFPMACRGQYAEMVKRSDPHALLLLYHFYRTARKLLPRNECWWVHQRASVGEEILRESLIRMADGGGLHDKESLLDLKKDRHSQ
jgi:hypothetical protein